MWLQRLQPLTAWPPCATEEFEIVEPDELEGALEVDAF